MGAVQWQGEPSIDETEDAGGRADLNEEATRLSYGEGAVTVLKELVRMHASPLTYEVVREVEQRHEE
jgi:hypothetical protein